MKQTVPVVEEGSWAEALGTLLAKLGVHVLDSRILPMAALGSAAQRLIRPATGAGVLAALGAAAGDDLGRMGRAFVTADVSAGQREQLRGFLLQVPAPAVLVSVAAQTYGLGTCSDSGRNC